MTGLTRRQAIQGAATLVGGALVSSQLTPFLARVARAADESTDPVFLDEGAFELVEHIVDVMIPETDTPGAVSAGVHYFVDLMLDEWAAPERQARYRSGLEELEVQLRGSDGTAFVDVSPEQRLERLQALDREAFGEGDDDLFYREFKHLVLFGYYSSEPGATLELQYERLIPDYKACESIDDLGGRAWFWANFSHGL